VGWSETEPSITEANICVLYQPRMMNVEQSAKWLTGETEVLGENLPPSAILSTTNPTCPDPGSNPVRRCVKPVTNRLSYGTAI
jgi:hypothetical protein